MSKEKRTERVEKNTTQDKKVDLEVIPGNTDILKVKLLASIVNSLAEIKGLLKDGRFTK